MVYSFCCSPSSSIAQVSGMGHRWSGEGCHCLESFPTALSQMSPRPNHQLKSFQLQQLLWHPSPFSLHNQSGLLPASFVFRNHTTRIIRSHKGILSTSLASRCTVACVARLDNLKLATATRQVNLWKSTKVWFVHSYLQVSFTCLSIQSIMFHWLVQPVLT